MKIVSLDGRKLVNKMEAHKYLQEMLEFPEYYGKNLDALYDCLTELNETEIIIKCAEVESPCLKRILRVFADAALKNNKLKVNMI